MLEQQIQEDIKAAMKAKDTVALAATRAIKGEILLFKTSEGGSKEVTDGDILKMIQKLIKQRKESAEQYTASRWFPGSSRRILLSMSGTRSRVRLARRSA